MLLINTTALIDADIVAYRCAAINENADLALAHWQTDQLLGRILEDVNAANWELYLSGDNNFRYSIDPEYKANRREDVKPKHLEGVREYLVTHWDASIADGYEADDAIGIQAHRNNVVICSIDKDLLQLPGVHYNFVRRTIETISEVEARRNFYIQLLVGDPSDNIRGCPGIGKVKAPKILEECNEEKEFFEAVASAYARAYEPEPWEHHLIKNAKLLHILQQEEDSFAWRLALDLVVE